MPVEIVTKGWIEVWRDGAKVSQHTVETKAIESALAHAEANGDGEYELRFPRKTVSVITKTIYPFFWVSAPNATFTTGTASSVDLRTFYSNVQGKAVTITVASGSLPSGVTIQGTSLHYDGIGAAGSGTYTLRLTGASFTIDSSSGTATVTGTVTNQPPYWTVAEGYTLPGASSTTGDTVSLAAFAVDPEGDPMAFARVGGTAPGNVTVGADGVLTRPAGLAAGTYTVVVDLTQQTAAGDLPALTLTGGGSGKAWTFGQPFAQGDVPAGHYVTATGPTSFQSEVRNYWPDGSVKFAVLSGIGGASAQLSATTTTPATGEVALSSSPASVTLSGAVTGTYACPITNTVGSWNKAAAHLVRKIAGPVMTERHYYVPTSDAHVAVWFYVRSYVGGAVEVETIVENGWLNVVAPGQKDYTVTVTVGGSSRYSGSVSHRHHTRWSRVDWVGTDPAITPAHDAAYLRSTKLVPNYSGRTPTAPSFSSTVKNPAPYAIGDYTDPMSAGGDSAWIALLPKWDAMYCSSGNATAYAALISNTRVLGRYGFYYRDETTGRIPLHQTYPTLTVPGGWGSTYTPAASGTTPEEFELQHSPSAGFTGYLVEGRWPFLETMEFAAFFAIFLSNPETRNGTQGTIPCQNSPMTTRGAAWSWRNTAQAAALSPTTSQFASADTALQLSFEASVRNTAAYNKARYIDGSTDGGKFRNTVGYLGMYDGQAEGSWWYGRCWMTAMQSWVLGYISDLGLNVPDLAAVRNHSYAASTQMQGDNSTWNFRHAGQYDRPYLKNTDKDNPVFPTVQEAYANMRTVYGLGTLTANVGDTLKRHGSDQDIAPTLTQYYTWQMPVLAQAVEHGQMASALRDRVLAASNYSVIVTGADNDPRFDVVPR